MRTCVLAELHGEVTDAACSARDEQRLPLLQATVVEDRLPRSEPGDGQRGRLCVAQLRRLLCNCLSARNGLLGIAAAAGKAEHVITLCITLCERALDGARQVVAKHDR